MNLWNLKEMDATIPDSRSPGAQIMIVRIIQVNIDQ